MTIQDKWRHNEVFHNFIQLQTLPKKIHQSEILLHQRSKGEISLWQRRSLKEKQKATPDLINYCLKQYNYLPIPQQNAL